MSSQVYAQHKAHTSNIGAFAILDNGEHVANITIRFPKDGASRLYAYAHWIGTEMVRGYANGYGYDKRSAALKSCADTRCKGWDKAGASTSECMFWEYLRKAGGQDWADKLREAGFTVISVC
jgi:hypothetical protein